MDSTSNDPVNSQEGKIQSPKEEGNENEVNSKTSFGINNNIFNAEEILIGNKEQSKTPEEATSVIEVKDNTFIIGGTSEAQKKKVTETIDNYIQDYEPSSKSKQLKNNVNEEIKHLEDSRILILDSSVEDHLNSMIASISSNERFSALKKKRLNFDRQDKGEINFPFRSLIEILAKQGNTVLIFFTNSTTSCSFIFKQILTNDFKTAIGEYQKILSDRNCYIVIAVYDKEHINSLNKISYDDFISRKHLSFLRYELSKIYEEDTVSELHDKIIVQQKNGRWSSDDFEFHTQVIRALEKGVDHFNLVVADENMSVEDFKTEDKLDAIKLIDTQDSLTKYISFIGANFQGLTLNEFQYIAHTLLNDPEKKEVITNPLKPDEKIERPLLKRWNESADSLLRLLHLKEQYSEQTESKILCFDKQGFIETFKVEFSSTNSLFSQQQFDYLFFEKGILFNDDTPYRVLENFIRLSSEIATNDPDMYCNRLLIYTTFAIINQKAKIDFQIDPAEENMEEAFEDFLNHIKEKHFELEIQKLEDFRKIGLLIAKMYVYSNLRTRIGKYFNLLIESGFNNTVFILIRYLKNIPDFDPLYWIRQLLERAPISIKKDIYQFLAWFLTQNEAKIMDRLSAIQSWYAGRSKMNSDSANIGICVIVDYLFLSINNISYEEYGQLAVKLHLFSNLKTKADQAARIEFLLEWLLHPALKEAFHTLDSFFNRNRLTEFNEDILALLFIRLKAIFTGIQKPGANDNINSSIQLGEQLIGRLVKKVTREQRKELFNGFNYWQNYYLDLKNSERTNANENKKIFEALSRIASSIKNHFNKPTNL